MDNPEEDKALTAAENANYSGIFGKERYWNGWGYTFASFIDSEVLRHFEDRYDSLQGSGNPKRIELAYVANVTVWSQIRVVNTVPTENSSIRSLTVSTLNGSVLLTAPNWDMSIAYKKGTMWQLLNGTQFSLEFVDCYLVDMEFRYSEVYDHLDAFFSKVNQIVVVDQDFEPILLCLRSSGSVA